MDTIETSTMIGIAAAMFASLSSAFLIQRMAYYRRRDDHERDRELELLAQAVAVDGLRPELGAHQTGPARVVVERSGPPSGQQEGPPPTSSLPQPPPVERLISSYHEQALGQARAQFWFSVAAATIGFVWILWAGSGIDPSHAVSAMRTIPGMILDAVAFLFFRQAAETRQRATDLYDRLRRDKQMSESAALVASIEDGRLRSVVKAQLALHMSGLAPNAIDLGAFLSSEPRSALNLISSHPPKPEPSIGGKDGKPASVA